MAKSQSVGPRVWIMPTLSTLALVAMHMLPGNDLDLDSWWAAWHMDKLLHLLAFGGCSLSWAIALAKQRRMQQGWFLECTLLGWAAFFGTVLEAVQGAWMPGRMFDLADVAADGLGALCSLCVFWVIFGQRPGRIASD